MVENSKSKSFEDISREMDEMLEAPIEIGKYEDDYAEMLELEAKRQSTMWTLAKIQAIDHKLEYDSTSERAVELRELREELVDSLEID